MSGNYGEPDWITTADPQTNAATQEEFSPSDMIGANTSTSSNSKNRATLTQRLLSIFCCLLAVCMCALGVLGFLSSLKSSSIVNASEVFICFYMVMFSLLLFTYELMWWISVPTINRIVRKNFGFMYGFKGKGLYLIFVAFLCVGLDNGGEEWLRYFTGVAFLSGGILHLFLVCFRPEIVETYQAPTAGLVKEDGNGHMPV